MEGCRFLVSSYIPLCWALWLRNAPYQPSQSLMDLIVHLKKQAQLWTSPRSSSTYDKAEPRYAAAILMSICWNLLKPSSCPVVWFCDLSKYIHNSTHDTPPCKTTSANPEIDLEGVDEDKELDGDLWEDDDEESDNSTLSIARESASGSILDIKESDGVNVTIPHLLDFLSDIPNSCSVRFCNLIDWSLYGRDFVHTCLWHGPLNSTMCLFAYGRAVQVLLTVQYTWTHIM